MMELTQTRIIAQRVPVVPANQQSRLVIALVLLLAALAAVLIKDRQFWFGSESTIADANDYQTPVATQTATPIPTPAQAPAQPATIKAATAAAPAHVVHQEVASSISQPTVAAAPAPPAAVVGNRTVLPPLDLEVVAGNQHGNLHPRSNTTKVQIAKSAAPVTTQPAPVVAATNAAPRERLAEAIPPSYPALAQHMNVQGSVVLQALIAADGTVQNLHVMSGPAILATAAQQAVRLWHFKPVYQNGQAVETRATITVNFSIKVNDSSANTSLADSRNDDALFITR